MTELSVSIDYERMDRIYPKQKAALTRAQNSGDPNRVVAAVEKAVREWNEVGAWPDGWHRWNIAYNDAISAITGRMYWGDISEL
jgi:hypothetical protein